MSISVAVLALFLLEQSLNTASLEEPIELRFGEDFFAPPGAVLFMSREEGMEKMLALARSGEAELSMLYLPRWKAWITITTLREMGRVFNEERYTEAALLTEEAVELWHMHNDVSLEPVSPERHKQLSLIWTLPSSDDLLQLYDFAADAPGSKLLGVVASVHGITEYWSDDPYWGQITYQRFAIQKEALKFMHEAEHASLDTLPELARSHQGFVKLFFTIVP